MPVLFTNSPTFATVEDLENVKSTLEERIRHLEEKLNTGRDTHHGKQPSTSQHFQGPPRPKLDGEAEEAARALEDLTSGTLRNQIQQEEPHVQDERWSQLDRERFAYNSILDFSCNSDSPSPDRTAIMPWLAGRSNRSIVDAMLKLIGPRSKADSIIDTHFASTGWMSRAIHAPSFRREYNCFWQILQTPERDFLDPIWLALLAAVAASGAQSHDVYKPTDLSHQLYEVAVYALEVGRPQSRFRFIRGFKCCTNH